MSVSISKSMRKRSQHAGIMTGRHTVTLRDVARTCGLSVYPVSRALNGCPGVNPETVLKVQQVATELGYKYAQNDLARRLSLRKSGETPISHVIGLMMPNHLEKVNFFFSMFRGISEEISSAGYGLLMLPTYDPVEHRSVSVQFPPSVMRGEVDGFIVHSGMSKEMLNYLRRDTGFGNRPIVTITSKMDSCPAILRDERLGANLAMEHLLSLGHRRILYISKNPQQYPENERLAGYGDACAGAGLNLSDCLIPFEIIHDFLLEEPLCNAVKNHPDATALLTHNDPAAIAACYLLQGMGMNIPGNFSVVGWDDSDPFPDTTGKNLLTSIRYDIIDMGRQAAKNLISLIENPGNAGTDIVMAPTLMARGSSAAPMKKTKLKIKK